MQSTLEECREAYAIWVDMVRRYFFNILSIVFGLDLTVLVNC